jgi:hypothetical protein
LIWRISIKIHLSRIIDFRKNINQSYVFYVEGGEHISDDARRRIEEMKRLVKTKEKGAVIVDEEGKIHDPRKDGDVPGTKVKTVIHG